MDAPHESRLRRMEPRQVRGQRQLSPQAANYLDEAIGTQTLRFPWGKRDLVTPLTQESFSSRERAYLAWVFRSPISETRANHLLFTALPQSFYPGKLIRDGRSKRARRAKWHTPGCT